MKTGKSSANKTIIMEVSATTTIISNKYEVNIKFKFTELDKHYVGDKLWLEKPIKILEYFHGYLNIWAIISAGSISKFSISIRSLRNYTISMLIDLQILNIFRFRFESILTKIIFSISVLTSSISRFFDFSIQKGSFAE